MLQQGAPGVGPTLVHPARTRGGLRQKAYRSHSHAEARNAGGRPDPCAPGSHTRWTPSKKTIGRTYVKTTLSTALWAMMLNLVTMPSSHKTVYGVVDGDCDMGDSVVLRFRPSWALQDVVGDDAMSKVTVRTSHINLGMRGEL